LRIDNDLAAAIVEQRIGRYEAIFDSVARRDVADKVSQVAEMKF
jgi:hypothetical protein